jgi:hypothetical protein
LEDEAEQPVEDKPFYSVSPEGIGQAAQGYISAISSGLSGGLMPSVTAGVEAAADVAGPDYELIDMIDRYRANKDRISENEAALRNQMPMLYGTTEAVAGAVSPLNKLAKGYKGVVGLGAAESVARGDSELISENPEIGEALTEAALGAGMGAGAQFGLNKLATFADPTVAQTKAVESMIPGASFKKKHLDKDVTNIGKSLLEDGKMTPLKSKADIAVDLKKKASEVNDQLDKVYQESGQDISRLELHRRLMEQADIAHDVNSNQKLGNMLEKEALSFLSKPMRKDMTKLIKEQAKISNIRDGIDAGTIPKSDKVAKSLEDAAANVAFLKERLQKLDTPKSASDVRSTRKALDAVVEKNKMFKDPDKKAVVDTIRDIEDELITDPAGKALKEQYSQVAKARDLATEAATKSGDVYSLPSGYNVAGRAGSVAAGSGDKKGMIGAVSSIVVDSLYRHYGKQLAASGLHKTSSTLHKYAPQFAKAVEQAGEAGIAATHFMLQQTDPKYRESYKKDLEKRKAKRN